MGGELSALKLLGSRHSPLPAFFFSVFLNAASRRIPRASHDGSIAEPSVCGCTTWFFGENIFLPETLRDAIAKTRPGSESWGITAVR